MSHSHQPIDSHKQSHHVIAVGTYKLIYWTLMVLLLATVLATYLPSSFPHLLIAMSIALVKAILIVLFFMHVYYSAPLTWITAVGSFLWVGLLLGFMFSDYFTRGWLHILGK